MKDSIALLLCDAYKLGHIVQYPENTVRVYSNFTPRKSRINGIEKVVFFGLQYFIKEYLLDYFKTNFFDLTLDQVIGTYKRRIRTTLGSDLPSYDHIKALHDLQYIPVVIKAVPEGTFVNMRVPAVTIYNTLPEFYWLPNFLETLLSVVIWQPTTSATIAHEYKKLLTEFARKTVTKTGDISTVNWQGHDFSMRGMGSFETSVTSGMAHLTSFWGTDTIPAIDGLEWYYGADADKEIVGGSVPATEHSVMCMGTKGDEIETFRRLITKVYPSGIVSIVSDTWDYFQVIDEFAPALKKEILSRTGAPVNKVVFRPDSGVPHHIIAGYRNSEVSSIGDGNFMVLSGPNAGKTISTREKMGTIEILWKHFGGTITEEGYKLLDEHVGCIYGDSITIDICREILSRLAEKGFASFNMVFGIGSFTYQFNTRDTFGFAMKATYGEIATSWLESMPPKVDTYEPREIYKDPITDDGTKKSARGLIRVDKVDNPNCPEGYDLVLTDQVSWEEEGKGILMEVFRDGALLVETSLAEIRDRLSIA